METIEKVLLAQRQTDGKFLRLDEETHTTAYDFVDEPELAERITVWDENDLIAPLEAPYYFENSERARDLWLKDCVMVAYEITTKISSKKL